MAQERKVYALFPTAVLRVPRALDAALVEQLKARFGPLARQRNSRSERLAHSPPAHAGTEPLLAALERVVQPHVVELGALLLGERLTWIIKEAWLNVLEPGGQQSLHNHANSIVSGVVYLSASHPSANTVFVKAPGGQQFVLDNMNDRAQIGPYNSDRWISPDAAVGDMLLFPSYLLHEVPVNRGAERSTLAFNAVPTRLDSWGYTLSLGR